MTLRAWQVLPLAAALQAPSLASTSALQSGVLKPRGLPLRGSSRVTLNAGHSFPQSARLPPQQESSYPLRPSPITLETAFLSSPHLLASLALRANLVSVLGSPRARLNSRTVQSSLLSSTRRQGSSSRTAWLGRLGGGAVLAGATGAVSVGGDTQSRRVAAMAAATDAGFFTDASDLIAENPPRLHYGVCAADVDGDGQLEFFVCGFGSENLLLKWNGSNLVNVARGTGLADPGRQSIGVGAGDIDGDGLEEVYVLNTDTFGGRKRFTDRLFDKQGESFVDLFSLPQNMDDANMCAGRSVCAVDRRGTGRYGFFVANYGGRMKLFELSPEGFLGDTAGAAGLVTYPTGGRALVALPLVSHAAMDIFAGNEGGPNFLFVNKSDGSGEYVESAAAYGLMDSEQNCRGVAVVDVEGSGELGLACGNWEGPHRLFVKAGPGPRGGASSLGFQDVAPDAGGFQDRAPAPMALPSRIRTVISADFDNDGFEELFFNNIGEPNRLFRQDGRGGWTEAAIGAALEPRGLGTGAAVADIDGDGRLELLVAHGESGMQPLSFFRPPANDNAWIRIQPLTRQGAPARGASVKVQDQSGRWQKRVIDAGSGYLCCMEPVAHFGLGQLAAPVKVRLMWPDGSVLDLDSLEPNRVHTVPHPSTGESTGGSA